MTDLPSGLLTALALIAGVTIDLNIAAAATIIAAIVAAYPSARLIAANRRKVLTEAGQVADARVLEFTRTVQADNSALRERVATLEGRIASSERRCDVLERLLMEHGIPVPSH